MGRFINDFIDGWHPIENYRNIFWNRSNVLPDRFWTDQRRCQNKYKNTMRHPLKNGPWLPSELPRHALEPPNNHQTTSRSVGNVATSEMSEQNQHMSTFRPHENLRSLLCGFRSCLRRLFPSGEWALFSKTWIPRNRTTPQDEKNARRTEIDNCPINSLPQAINIWKNTWFVNPWVSIA